MVARLITINSNKSTTLGGVESLIRNLHSIYGKNIIEIYELKPTQEYYNKNKSVEYKSFGCNEDFFLSKIKTKIRQWKTVKKLKIKSDDTIVFFHPNDILYIPLRSLINAKVIVVQTNRFDKYFSKYSYFIWIFLGRWVDTFTVYTNKDKDVAEGCYILNWSEIKVIPRGCRLKITENPPLQSNKLVTIARIDEKQKNFTFMLDVINYLPSNYTLSIYGSGTEAEVESLKRLISGNQRVKYLGGTSDVGNVLSKHAVFIMTSKFEGFGQTLIEARSQGIPCVALNTFDAAPWVIKDGITGYLVDSCAKEFATRVVSICGDESAYRKFSSNSIKYAVETDKRLVDSLWREVL